MYIEAISLTATAVSLVAVTGGYAEYRRLVRSYRRIMREHSAVCDDLKIERQTSEVLGGIVESQRATIALQKAEIDKWAKTRSAMARAGGLARAMQQRKNAEQKTNAARDRTVETLAAAPLRPRAEVVAGVAEARAAKKSGGVVAPS